MTQTRPALIVSLVAATALALPAHAAEPGWGSYGGDAGGQRFSAARQITRANVKALKPAWSFSTGVLTSRPKAIGRSAFENTPILAGGRLYVCSPFNEVSALDPGTGAKLWRFDPKIDGAMHYPNSFNCRGVAYWRDPAPLPGPCAERIFMATNDRRLFALDAATGRPCAAFGNRGMVAAIPDVKLSRPDGAQVTSAPVIARGTVIVGSSIDDNQKVDETSGAVHGFDARTGALKWSFDPLGPARATIKAGAANVWAPMSVDEARGLVFLPTSSPSPDFYGASRPGNAGYADSVVALHVETGKVAWAFQTVHHNVWDYDVPAQPTLATVRYGGKTTDAVIQTTKQGLVFTLNRDTGVPVIPVVERPVPQGGAPGEVLSPTQPFPILPRPLAPHRVTAKDAFGLTPWDRDACAKLIASGRNEGFYTPPSTQGTIIYPFTGGGSNWGGIAFDPGHGVAYVNTSSAIHKVTLIPAKGFKAAKAAQPDLEISPNAGAPYAMKRELLRSPLGLPCNPPPWGTLHAVDMTTGKVLWEVPLGTTQDLAPFSQFVMHGTGTPNFGGPIVTAGGLVFIGAAMDNYLRAFDAASGKELWRGRLPAGGQATPMTYVWKGRQYVVIAAGGHAKSGTKRGDSLVAFALPS
jgi:quinoprotein glucose dehydrogenase